MESSIFRRISTGWLKSRLRLIQVISLGMNKVSLLFHIGKSRNIYFVCWTYVIVKQTNSKKKKEKKREDSLFFF
jgi:hypothetical protein